jgi:two-component system, LytTR family, sensor kinase
MGVVLKRAQIALPGFWTLQIIGWSCYYLLLLVSILPSRQMVNWLWESHFCTLTMFIGSCLLRPVCRALSRKSYPWISLEVRAFAFAFVMGIISAVAGEFWADGIHGLTWAKVLDTTVQATITLFLWCSLYFSIKQWQQSTQERERLLRAEAEVREARLSALRYQLNPHFLFNSLNAVSTLVLDGNATAATRMLAQIGELLRTILDSESANEAMLSQEIAATEQYLAIEQTRLGERLRLDVVLAPDTLDAMVPCLLLQPLVENAVRHGIAPRVEGGMIRIRSLLHNARLQISIQNSGAAHADANRPVQPANGIGLKNTSERLRSLYGDDHKFELQWPEAGGCEVTMELPLRRAAPTGMPA